MGEHLQSTEQLRKEPTIGQALESLKKQESENDQEKGRAINVLFIHDETEESKPDALDRISAQLAKLRDVKFYYGSNNQEKGLSIASQIKDRIGILQRKYGIKKELNAARTSLFDKKYVGVLKQIASESGAPAMLDYWIANPDENSPHPVQLSKNYQKFLDIFHEISYRMPSDWPEITIVCIVDKSIGVWLADQTGKTNQELGTIKLDKPVVARFHGGNSPMKFSYNGQEYPLKINDWQDYKGSQKSNSNG